MGASVRKGPASPAERERSNAATREARQALTSPRLPCPSPSHSLLAASRSPLPSLALLSRVPSRTPLLPPAPPALPARAGGRAPRRPRPRRPAPRRRAARALAGAPVAHLQRHVCAPCPPCLPLPRPHSNPAAVSAAARGAPSVLFPSPRAFPSLAHRFPRGRPELQVAPEGAVVLLRLLATPART